MTFYNTTFSLVFVCGNLRLYRDERQVGKDLSAKAEEFIIHSRKKKRKRLEDATAAAAAAEAAALDEEGG